MFIFLLENNDVLDVTFVFFNKGINKYWVIQENESHDGKCATTDIQIVVVMIIFTLPCLTLSPVSISIHFVDQERYVYQMLRPEM